jgi:hypothetical protein
LIQRRGAHGRRAGATESGYGDQGRQGALW